MENFIGIYPGAMPRHQCQGIIDFFEKNTGLHQFGKMHHQGVEIHRKDIKDSTDIRMNITHQCDTNNNIIGAIRIGIQQYKDKFPILNEGALWDVSHEYNLQRYYPGQGFHHPHIEYHPSNKIMLAWMIYLNDVNDGGETRFEYYDMNIKPQEGMLVIWPAYFTHLHYGLVSSETKYIATGWHSFIDML